LIGEIGGGSGFTDGVNGDQVGDNSSPIDPDLGALQDNGGPTLTHALDPSSPAIDAGDNSGAPSTDQRGENRIYNDTVDIGSYEYQGSSLMGSQPGQASSESIDVAAAHSLMAAAIASWQGASAVDATVDVRLEVADLDGAQLAAAEIFPADGAAASVWGRIVIDNNAAGHLWHTDLTVPPPTGAYDLFTVMVHEVGHLLGYDHESVLPVMHESVPLGVRAWQVELNSPLRSTTRPSSALSPNASHSKIGSSLLPVGTFDRSLPSDSFSYLDHINSFASHSEIVRGVTKSSHMDMAHWRLAVDAILTEVRDSSKLRWVHYATSDAEDDDELESALNAKPNDQQPGNPDALET
jgi:hypothetical protein